MTKSETEILESLKNNRTPWKWLKDSEKSKLLRAKKKGMMIYLGGSGSIWLPHNGVEAMGVVYRIHEDYKVEKERPDVPRMIANLSSWAEPINGIIDCIQWLYDRDKNND